MRTIHLPKSTTIPLLKVQCGLFGIQDDFFEDYLSLDERLIRNKHSTFFFRASGNSMSPTIFDGDILVVDRSLKAINNHICVFNLEGEMICKRLKRNGNGVILVSDNDEHKSISITDQMDFTLFGVVVAVARDLRGE